MADVDVHVRNKIARTALERLGHAWNLTPEQTTQLSAARSSEEPLSEESLTRIAYLIRIFEGLVAFLGRGELARSWVNRPNDHFQGETPLAVMLRDGLAGIQKLRLTSTPTFLANSNVGRGIDLMICSRCGATIARPPIATLKEIKDAIAAIATADRAQLRPWLLARFDARGYPLPPPRETGVTPKEVPVDADAVALTDDPSQ